MPSLSPAELREQWTAAVADAALAAQALAAAPGGIVRQSVYTRLLRSRRACVAVVHSWLARALGPVPVHRPRAVLVVCDGVLTDDSAEVPAVGITGALALRLLQTAGIAVVLSSAACGEDLDEIVDRFQLLDGVAERGALRSRAWPVAPAPVAVHRQLAALRATLRADLRVVLDPWRTRSVRVSCVVNGGVTGLPGDEALALLEQHGLSELDYVVAPSHTDFFATGLDATAAVRAAVERITDTVPLQLYGIGATSSDLPALRDAGTVFLSMGDLPGRRTAQGQRLVRCRQLADGALWEAAWHLTDGARTRRPVLDLLAALECPDWLPQPQRNRPALGAGPLSRLERRWPVATETAAEPAPTGHAVAAGADDEETACSTLPSGL